MLMRMLAAGGCEVMSDGVRGPDESNPAGYYEYERVKTLDQDTDKSWLQHARGKAIKIMSFLLRELPDSNNYRVIFMHRKMDEVIASQRKMLTARGTADTTADDRLALGYQEHLVTVKQLLARRRCFDVLEVNHGDVMSRPLEEAARIARFLDQPLDETQMAAAVDPGLYRNRH